MLGTILILLIFGFIYILYKINYYKQKVNHLNYIMFKDELKEIEDDYTNGKYDFLTYKEKRNELLEKYNIPLDYKEGELN